MGDPLSIASTVSAVLAMLAAIGLAASAVVDVRTLRLPDRLTAAITVITGLLLITAGIDGWAGPALHGLVAGAGYGAVFGAANRHSPDQLGRGDAKLAPAVGALVGLSAPSFPAVITTLVHALLGSCVLFCCYALAGRAVAGRRREYPFGPALVAPAILSTARIVATGGVGSH